MRKLFNSVLHAGMGAYSFGIAAAVCLSITSCSTEGPKTEEKTVEKVVLPAPFHFHKAIEVTPGLTFDVVSWGRGAGSSGALLILRSDSVGTRYRSVSAELQGLITDAWNMDMDADGNPEIFVQAKGDGPNDYLNMYVYEFDNNGSSRELRFPELTSSTKRNYRGKDSLYIKEGSLFREFPLYEDSDTASVKPTGKKILEYSLRGNRFDATTVNE